MVEQPHAGEGHDHAQPVAFLNNVIIPHGAAGFCDVADAAALRTLDVVRKREECIAPERNAGNAIKVSALLLLGEARGALAEQVLPAAVRKDLLRLIGKINVDGVVAVRPFDAGQERERKRFFMLAQMPKVGLVACDARAVDAGLLPCPHADGLPILCKADGIGLYTSVR